MANAIKLEIPILPGVRQDINRYSGAQLGALRTADNVRFERTGEVRRRNGHVADVTVATADYACLLAPRGDLAIWNNSGKVFYGPFASGQSQDVGFFPTLRPLRGRGTFTADSYAYPGPGLPAMGVTSDGYQLIAFSGQTASSGARYIHFQHKHPDGRILSSGTIDVTFTLVVPAPRIATMGSELILAYRDTPTVIQIRRFQTSGSVASGSVTYASLDSWDISPFTSTRWILVTSDQTDVVIREMSSTSTVSSSRTTTPSVSINALSVYGTATRAYVGFAGPTSGRVLVYTFSAGFAAPTEVSCWTSASGCELPPMIGPYAGVDTVVRVVGTAFDTFTDGEETMTTCRYRSGVMSGTSFSSDGGDTPWNVYPVSRPFGPLGQYTIVDRISDIEMDPDANDSDLKCHRGVLRREDSTGQHVWELSLHAHNRNEGGAIAGPAWPVTVATDLDGTYLFFDKKIYPRGDIRTAWNAYFEIVGFGEDRVVPELGRGHAQTLDATSVAGQLCDFTDLQPVANRDSSSVYAGIDVGFPTPPGIIHSIAHTSGPLEELSTYQFLCVYRYHDALGRIHWSALSNKVSVTTGASQEGVTIYVSLENVTRKSFSQDVTVEIYRTEKNGSTFYLEASMRGSPLNSGDGCALFTVAASDALLVTRELLYTHSRVESQMPPASRYVVHTKNRTWLGGLFRENIIQASMPRVQQEAPTFNDASVFKIALPQPCTGLAGLGDVLVAFAKFGVFAIYGEGPNDRGEGTFSEPQVISLAIGCINARSIVQAEDSVLFQSTRGIEILGRGLAAPEYLGEAIQEELASRPFVMSSWYNAAKRTAHFLVASAFADPPTDVRILVYDFLSKAWSVDTAVDGTVAAGVFAPDVGEILWQREAGAAGGILQSESATACLDGTVTFSSTLTFHDIYPFGRDGSGVVNQYALVVAPADADVVTQVLGVDHITPRSVDWAFTTVTGDEEYRYITPTASSKCSSVQVSMACSPTASTDQTKFLGAFLWVIGAENDKRLATSTERA